MTLHATDDGDVVAQILASAPAHVARARSAFARMSADRSEIRRRLLDSGFIRPLPDQPGSTDIVCVDGGTAVKGLYAGDLIVTAAVALEGGHPSDRIPEGAETRSWTHLGVGHSTDPSRVASAAMACAELRLLAEQPHDHVLIDGSHQTFVLALASALRSAGPLLAELVDLIDRWDVPQALTKVCTDARIIASPKSDATDAFAKIVAADPVNLPADLQQALVGGDKVLAAMLLEPGEMTRPSPAPKSWSQLRIAHPELTGRAKTVASALDTAIAPLRDAAAEGSTAGIGLTYVMPDDAVTALKVEYKRVATDAQVAHAARTLADDTVAMHAQEPVCQFKADAHAKAAMAACDTLHGEIVREVAENGDDWVRYFVLSSRTSTSGAPA